MQYSIDRLFSDYSREELIVDGQSLRVDQEVLILMLLKQLKWHKLRKQLSIKCGIIIIDDW